MFNLFLERDYMKNLYLTSLFLISVLFITSADTGWGQNKNQAKRSSENILNNGKIKSEKQHFLNNKWQLITHNNRGGSEYLSEDFDGIPGATGGGAGTYAFPSGWVLVNVDGLTPAGSVSYVNEAWERREDFANNVGDSAAFSTSWYTPAGQANDWMISPPITIGANTILRWNAVTYDPDFPDGYEVRISTTTQDVSGCLANPSLFSIAAENTIWTERSVDLTAAGYLNQTIYLAWRNNSIDKFLLLVDDIVVEDNLQFDAQITSVLQPSEYTILPTWQEYPLDLGASVRNNGLSNITNVEITVNVYQSNVLVHTDISTPIATLPPDSTIPVLLTAFAPLDTGVTAIEYIVSVNETDVDASNDSGKTSVYLSENEFARDDNIPTGTLGIGAGNGGELGQSYVLQNPGFIRSIKLFQGLSYIGEPVYANVRNFENGQPTDLVAVTDTFFAPDVNARWITLGISGGEVSLPADTFVVTLNEVDSTLALGNTATIFTPGTGWVIWPTSPFGGWANVEDFGIGFARPFMLRPFVYEETIPVELTSFRGSAKGTKVFIEWETASEINNRGFSLQRKINSEWNEITFVQGKGTTTGKNFYFFSDDVSTSGIAGKIYYRLQQFDFDGTSSLSYEIEVELNPLEYKLSQNYPNPFNPSTKISFQLADESFITLKIFNILGNEITTLINEKKPAGFYNYNFNASSLASGIYFYTLKASNPESGSEQFFVDSKKMILIK